MSPARSSLTRLRVAVSVADIHRDPAHESELVTQAVMGDLLQVLESADEGRWHQVQLPDSYRGWIRSWLATESRRGWPGPDLLEVDVPLTWIRSRPDPASDPVSDVVIGTRLARRPGGRSGWVAVTLPDGREGFLPRTDLLGEGRPRKDGLRRPPAAAALIGTARRFLGVPYVWGGRSPKGLDCSGLTQMVYDLHGISIPRDSRDQRSFIEKESEVTSDPLEVPPGGLLFFGRTPSATSHVGISMGSGDFIHARGWVKVESLDKSNRNYNNDLASLFQVGSKVY